MRRAVMITACAALAACGSEAEVDVRNASVGEVAKEVADASREGGTMIRPGKWQSAMRIESIEAPGMPDSARSAMRGMSDRNQVYESCLTPEQAKRPKEDFFAGRDNSCRYDHFTMGGGRIDARMRCSQGGTSQVMELDGEYSPTAYSMRMTTSTEGGQGPAANVRMRMRVDAKRIGECDGKRA